MFDLSANIKREIQEYYYSEKIMIQHIDLQTMTIAKSSDMSQDLLIRSIPVNTNYIIINHIDVWVEKNSRFYFIGEIEQN